MIVVLDNKLLNFKYIIVMHLAKATIVYRHATQTNETNISNKKLICFLAECIVVTPVTLKSSVCVIRQRPEIKEPLCFPIVSHYCALEWESECDASKYCILSYTLRMKALGK